MPGPKSDTHYTIKYIIALSIIAILSISTYWMIGNAIEQEKDSMPAITLSRQQTMLCQHLAFLSIALANSDSLTYTDTRKKALEEMKKMWKIQQQLVNGNDSLNLLPPVSGSYLDRVYCQPPLELYEKTKVFITNVQKLINLDHTVINNKNNHIKVISDMASGDFFKELEGVSIHLEEQSQAHIHRLQILERFVLFFTLFILAMEAFFIFAPMVRQITREKRSLFESQKKLDTILNTVGEGIIMVDQEGYIMMVNQEVENMSGFEKESLIGKHFNALCPPGFQNMDLQFVKDYFTIGVEPILNKHHELIAQRANGTLIPVDFTVTKTEFDNNLYYTIAVSDITERKKAQDELIAYKDELEQKVISRTKNLNTTNEKLRREIIERKKIDKKLKERNEELVRSNDDLKQFASVASHDLKEPLRMVSVYVQLLATRYGKQLDEDAQSFINYAVDGAKRATGLIEDLLEYSRVDRRKGKPKLIDLNDVMSVVLKNLEVSIVKNDALLEIDPLPKIYADTFQMVQLFQNLVSNAIKFKKEDTQPVVKVSVVENLQNFTFTVQDNGIGIDPQYSEKVFMIFQRLHSQNSYEGTGVGLAICKKIVERHGGKIWLTSRKGEGTTFHFELSKALIAKNMEISMPKQVKNEEVKVS